MNIGIEDLIKIRQIMDEYRALHAQYSKVLEDITLLMNRISDLENHGKELSTQLLELRNKESKLLETIRSAPDFNQEEFQKLLFTV